MTRRLLFGAIALALVLTVQFALYRILERFDPDEELGPGSRMTLTSNTIEAARAYMPVGSGLGSFVPVYHLFEQPQDLLDNRYVNRPANDVAEAWLETGVLGVALMGWFAFWFVRRSLEIWRIGLHPQADPIDWSLARSATIIVPLLAVHSFFDYPLRTTAMMAVAAFACALMIAPPDAALRPRLARKTVRAATKDKRAAAIAPVLVAPVASPAALALRPPATSLPPASKERWGTDMEWPEEWRPSKDEDPPKAPKGSGRADD